MRGAISTIGRWRGRGTLLFTDPGQETGKAFLDRFETGPGRGGRDVVRPGNPALATILGPRFLLAAKVALDPGNGDNSPDPCPGEGKRPTQLQG